MENANSSSSQHIAVVVKALNIIKCFTFQEPVHTLNSLCQKLDMPKSTAYRLLATLQSEHFLEKDQDGNYRLGLSILNSASAVLQSIDYRAIARPHLLKLASDLDETIYLSALNGSNVIYLDEIQRYKYTTFGSKLGNTVAAYTSAMGRVLLSQMTYQEFEETIMRQPLTPRTPKTVTDPSILWNILREVSVQGYAFDDEEFEMGICCIAAPIRDLSGSVVAAFGISAPSVRLNKDTLLKYLPSILDTSYAISSDLGYQQPLRQERRK